jgi:hypothetical protein
MKKTLGKEMKGIKVKTVLIFGIVTLLFITSISPLSIGQTHTSTPQQQNITAMSLPSTEKTTSITFYIIGKNGLEKQEKTLTTSEALEIYEKYQELKKEITTNQNSDTTQQVQKEFFDLLVENHATPTGMTTDQLLTLVQPPAFTLNHLRTGFLPFQTKASEWFCNFVSLGDGSAFPIIILPRLIPFLLTPIPRVFVWWSTPSGVTSVGGLISRTGFIAGGTQKGIALGFWGIGFSIFLPPIMSYGLFGYALYARVTAEEFEFWPPNYPPEITQTDPADDQQMVPLTTTALRFNLDDMNGDLMSYNVTTEPDIGSGSGGLKPSGTYSIPISGLESLTQYTWIVQVTDGKEVTEKTMTFTTEPIAPIITNPLPTDGERDVPMDLPQLQFTMKDYQGDTMEYTVQTSPNIGSAHVTGVHDGTYTVPLSGMTYGATYRWYLNATDGTHWTRKVYSYETGYPSQFDPFEFGWQYRKQITINHTQVSEDLENFPVFVSAIDSDLIKAQDDGGDILFMNGPGVAKRQYHEIEIFDQTTGNLAAWVNTPVLSTSHDTVFYMYYGNPICINQQYPQKTWNSHYEAVWHLNNNPTGTIVDSTANDNDGINHGSMSTSDLVDGKTGKCLNFDGTDDYISVPDSSSLKPTDVTLIAWFQPQTGFLPRGDFLAKQCYDYWGNSAGHTYSFSSTENSFIAAEIESDTYQQFDRIGDYQITPNTWYYLVLTFDGTTKVCSFYVNGILEGTKSCDSSALWYNNPWDFTIGGCRWGDGSSQAINTFYNCGLDEIKVLNEPLNPGWISTEYTNQNNPAGFYSIGSEETGL